MAGSEEQENIFDVAIVGAGIYGSALAYILRRYSNVSRIVVTEKCPEPASVNSAAWNNSQTLHFGDIETNYDLEKSRTVRDAALRVQRYLEKHDKEGAIHTRYHKMVIGVGEGECSRLEKRYSEYKEDFPDLELIEEKRIAELEPSVMRGRDPKTPVKALYTANGITIDYGKLARSFIEQSKPGEDGEIQYRFGKAVTGMERVSEDPVRYRLKMEDGESLQTRFLVVAAGGHSLLFAKSLGYGQNWGLLSVAGSFFKAEKKLNGKVYTMQVKELPFAAAHGDPEVHDSSMTRFGPTAKPLPLLERHNYSTFVDYFRSLGFSWGIMASLIRILARPIIFKFAVMNSLYELPFLGKRLFLKQIRKIVPELQAGDIRRAKGYGGVRPQIVDIEQRDLDMGEAKLEGRATRFVITPSPGASVCLNSAAEDAEAIAEALGDAVWFDKEQFDKDTT